MPIAEMLSTHPRVGGLDLEKVVRSVEACFECAQTCESCADACLAEEGVADLRRCIRLNLDCAAVCATTGEVLVRQTEPNMTLLPQLLEACVVACAECAAECEMHAGHHAHCRICAEACRRCEAACNDLLRSMGRERRAAA